MKRRARWLLATSVLMWMSLALAVPVHAADDPWQPATSALDSILKHRLGDVGVARGALVVVHRGRLEYAGGFGQTAGHPIDPAQTVFHAASNSKTFVAAAAMQLAAEGRLDLHADVNKYLKRFQVPRAFGAPVTMDALLTHSAGFDDHFLGGQVRTGGELVPLGDYLAEHLPARVVPPGQQIIYSNHAMALAGYVVEVVSGESFATYVQRHIFDPLGMTSSSFAQPAPAGIATREVKDVRGGVPFLNPYPAGSLVSTPEDMGRFVADQLGSPVRGSTSVLSGSALKTMHDGHFTPVAGMPGAAYGYFESNANGHPSLHHTGDGGDHSLLYLVPDAGLGFYLVYSAPAYGNTSTPREQIAKDLIDLYLPGGQPFAQPKPPSGFAARADSYTGTYRLEPYSHNTVEKLAALNQEITISNPGDGSLAADLGGGQRIRLVEMSPNLFRDPDGAYIAFRSDKNGAITGLSFTGAAVDDPGSAHRLQWWETSTAMMIFIAAAVLLMLIRGVSGLIFRWRHRKAVPRVAMPLAWRLMGWIGIGMVVAVALGIGSLVAARGFIGGVPLGLKMALVLVNLVALGATALVPLTILDIVGRRGGAVQRTVLAPSAVVGTVLIAWLAYWNVLGLRL